MTNTTISRPIIRMAGAQTAANPDTLAAILDATLADPRFAPEKHSTNERVMDAFDHKEACLLAMKKPSQANIYLRRKKVVSYEAILGQARRSTIAFQFSEKTNAKHREGIFELGDRIAEAFRPDIGFSHLYQSAWQLYPSGDAGVHTSNMINTGMTIGAGYWSKGVGGLGHRTYIGPFVIKQIGMERLLSLPSPALVQETSWGGLRIDLVASPWEQDEHAIQSSWIACMRHLRPSDWFAKMEKGANHPVNGTITLTPPTHEGWSPGGVIRE